MLGLTDLVQSIVAAPFLEKRRDRVPCNFYMSSREDVADGKAPQTEQPGGEAFTGTTDFVFKVYFTRIFSHSLSSGFGIRYLGLGCLIYG